MAAGCGAAAVVGGGDDGVNAADDAAVAGVWVAPRQLAQSSVDYIAAADSADDDGHYGMDGDADADAVAVRNEHDFISLSKY